jgi:glutamyl-Q tRNA(Asp) synthetase
MAYHGRFAPTPSGPLHLGSLLTAVASYLEARARHGTWRVRVDDIDPPREVTGAADTILRQLDQHGLHWDGHVRYQSTRHDAYATAVERLLRDGHAFYCTLSRRELAQRGGVHPGPSLAAPDPDGSAVRLAVPSAPVTFTDRLQGAQSFALHEQEGAFVIRRRDGLYAYQLACALDDADDGITDVVRGIDLIDSTPRQLHVLDCLGRARPRYGHLPVLVDADGQKLSKSAGAAALGPHAPANLTQALHRLGLAPPADLAGAPCPEQLAWALPHWSLDRLAGQRTCPVMA